MASAFRILGEGQLSLTKFLIATDQPVDLKDFRATLEHLLARTQPETDLYVFSNLSMDTLDYTGPEVNKGSKGVWLGLGDPVRELPREFRPSIPPPSDVTDVRVFCGGCLVVGGPTYAAEPRRRRAPGLAPRVCGLAAAGLDRRTRAGRRAARSISSGPRSRGSSRPATSTPPSTRVVRHHVTYTPPVVIDARLKPGFPAELFCAPDVADTVDPPLARVLSRGVEMGDSAKGHLD